ncbi:MAG: hypothetical protein OZ919_00765 [Xanthomonadaceae bacterium]|nr:hypothetical protein [Xanthomonadaceae bacterium]
MASASPRWAVIETREDGMTGHAARFITGLAMASVLAGCSSSPASRAALACEEAAKERAEGKMLSVDLKALEQSMVNEGEDVLRLQAPVTLDTGLQTQYTQTLDCRVKVANGELHVVRVTFVF